MALTGHATRHTGLYALDRTWSPLPRIEQLLDMIGEPVSGRTLRRWRALGQLKPRGYWRPDGHRGTVRRSDADTPV